MSKPYNPDRRPEPGALTVEDILDDDAHERLEDLLGDGGDD